MDNRLKELRGRYDLTQGDLAEAIGCSRTTINLIEANQRNPSGEVVVRLHDFFKGEERIFFPPSVQTSVREYLAKRREVGG